MMKLLFSLSLTLYSALLFSQQERTLSGSVLDADTKEAIPYATIAVYTGDQLVDGVSSDDNGSFTINLKDTHTQLEVSFIGYKKSTHNIAEITTSENITVYLQVDNNALEEVVIQGERTTSQLKIDRKVINLGSDIQQSGVNALEAFEQFPEVQTDVATGTVALRGSDNIQILVNGKLSPLNAAELLQQIQASQIDRVEIITSPSAKHRAEGLSGIINIILKRQQNNGLNLTTNASVGTRRYTFDTNGNYNNSWLNFKLNLSHSKNKETNNQLIKRVFSNGYRESISTPYEFDGKVNRIATGLDFFISDQHELSLAVDYTDDAHDYYNNSSYFNVTNSNDFNYLRENTHKHYVTVFNANYRWNLDGDNHFIELDYNLNSSKNDYPLTDSEDGIKLFDQELTEDFTLQSLALDYTFPLNDAIMIETGLARNTQFLESTLLVAPAAAPQEYNEFEYDEILWGAYAQTKFSIDKLAIQAGLRYERFTSESVSQTNNFSSVMKFSNWFPSLHLSYALNDESNLNIGYSKRVSRPNFHHVNAFQIVSPLYIWEYNPNITPEFSDNIELSYQTNIDKLHIGLTTFYRHRKDVILWTLSGINNQQVFRYENAGTFNTYGIEGNFRYKFASFWNSRLTANYYFSKVNESLAVTWNKVYSAAFQFKNTFKINKAISSDLTYIYRAKNQRVFNYVDPRSRLDLAVRARFLDNKLIASFRLMDIFNTNTIKRTTITDNLNQETNWDFQMQTRNFLFGLQYKLFENKGKTRNRMERQYHESPIE